MHNISHPNMYECGICGATFKKQHSHDAHMSMHDTNMRFVRSFEKQNMNDVQYTNNVPKVVYICWFGGYGCDTLPHMTPNRFAAFESVCKNIGVPVILLTNNNYKNFIKPGFPVHRAFDYLSGVHKSDYFRCYMLHHYGGGYHDIKHRLEPWANCWDTNNWTDPTNSTWMYGRREKYPGAIGYPPGKDWMKQEFEKMATMCWIICKPNTPYTTELLNQINNRLDEVYSDLIKFPGINGGGYYSQTPFELVPKDSYPLRWLELLGEIFHPLMLKYTEHIQFGLPDAIKKRYK